MLVSLVDGGDSNHEISSLTPRDSILGAVIKREADQLKSQLKMKEEHKKSRVKLAKVNMSNGLLITKEEIDQLKLDLEEKETKAAEKQHRAKEKNHNRARSSWLYQDLESRRGFLLHL